jgi:hypothetical protein
VDVEVLVPTWDVTGTASIKWWMRSWLLLTIWNK